MQTSRWDRAKGIFHAAVAQPEPDRDAFLLEACGPDGRLREQVETLLAAHEEAGPFLSNPTQDGAGGRDVPDDADLFGQLQEALAGRYSLHRELGRGGMGIVYLARDVALDRPVAIKVLPAALSASADARTRFLREARTAAGLSHPNIVPIHLVEERDDLVYFVMAYVGGESLGDRVRRAGPLKPADAARLVQEVAWALGYAHGRGVIHRDIKPDNILLDKGSGRALVTDFGIARVTTQGTVSQQGEVLGTLRYMSPEQAGAEEIIDGRADLYSLGVTTFFALTGRLPFESDTAAALIAAHVAEPPPPLKSVRNTVPAKLAEAVDRCLAKSPDDRFATGEALADAIAESRVTRRSVPPSVREFLAAARASAWQLAGLGALWLMVIEALPRAAANWTGRLIGSPLDPLIFFLAGITPLVAIRPILAARGVLRAGLDHRDVAEAAAVSATDRDANVEYEVARIERLGERLSTVWGRSAFALLAAALVPILVEAWGDVWAWNAPVWTLLGAVAPLLGFAFMASLAVAPKRILRELTRGTPEFGELWRRLWDGPAGRWFFKLVGAGLRKRPPPVVPDDAATEILLGRAAGDLFDQLPEGHREELGDVREVIRGLKHAAATLRTRRDELAAALGDVGQLDGTEGRAALVQELEEVKAATEERLGRAVGALEHLRLDLLRLRSGLGNADDLTQAIEEARSVREAVDEAVAARREVDGLLGPGTAPEE